MPEPASCIIQVLYSDFLGYAVCAKYLSGLMHPKARCSVLIDLQCTRACNIYHVSVPLFQGGTGSPVGSEEAN